MTRANELIGEVFDNTLFWSFRYANHPERGSGVGSRGEHLEYKRNLLRANGVEHARSVLDIGCGDLEVIKSLKFNDYTGLDTSVLAIERARSIMPDGQFHLGLPPHVGAADIVVCLEVLIHQPHMEDYRRLIAYAAARAGRSLIISGYDIATPEIEQNSMVFFHEPLRQSLEACSRFSSVRAIGRHSDDVVVYRCDV